MSLTSDVTFLSLLILLSITAAQPPAAPPPYTFNPSVATIIVIILSAVFFFAFFSLYLRLCSGSSSAGTLLSAASLRRRNPGLDAAAVAAFPVFQYSEVKELKIGNYALECAICLNEFEDDETLRLIPKCNHVFHPECIDAWLGLHVTCPVCRANLSEPEKTDTDATLTGESISVRVVPSEVDDPAQSEGRQTRCFVDPAQTSDQGMGRQTRFSDDALPARATDQGLGRRMGFLGKFPRSHSTGHSLVVVRPGADTERFTLRLPDHVRKEVMTRALIRTATFNITEGSSRRGRRGGEGSSRGARSYKRLDRAVKSDRWVINVPFFSGKVTAGDGEGSTGKGKVTAVRLPSFKCLEPSTSGDVDSVGPIRPAVLLIN